MNVLVAQASTLDQILKQCLHVYTAVSACL